MPQPWFILSKRYGGDVRSPSTQDLAHAAAELFVENIPGMTTADYEEHGEASLRYGYDDGPMYVIAVGRSGTATFEQWADQDFNTELAAPKTLDSLSQQEVAHLWLALCEGRIAEVQAAFEVPGDDA